MGGCPSLVLVPLELLLKVSQLTLLLSDASL